MRVCSQHGGGKLVDENIEAGSSRPGSSTLIVPRPAAGAQRHAGSAPGEIISLAAAGGGVRRHSTPGRRWSTAR